MSDTESAPVDLPWWRRRRRWIVSMVLLLTVLVVFGGAVTVARLSQQHNADAQHAAGVATPTPTDVAQPSTPSTTATSLEAPSTAASPSQTITSPAPQPATSRQGASQSTGRPPQGKSTLWPAPTGADSNWAPTLHLQYTGNVAELPPAQVVNLDGHDTPAATVRALRARGSVALCYINAGAWESWRPDASAIPARVRGNEMDGWPGEEWLDVRDVDTLISVMGRRMDICRDKGFQGVDADNVDAFEHDTGFALNAADQLRYVRALAQAAHDRGLLFGLKNNTAQIGQLAPSVDFAINESCHKYQECHLYRPLLERGKPVWVLEYDRASCAADPPGMRTYFANRELNAPLSACRT